MGKAGTRVAIILLGVIGYALTMARTVSFWDCGEYIAASNILGIPHPPGNPLFVLLGRVFILLFGWINGPAFAVNLISAISSIFCCLLIFEITVKILPKEFEKRNLFGFFAASISLFGNTFWFNAVEAGAYGISMLIIMLQIYLILKWNETYESVESGELRVESWKSWKYLLFILYISFLGLGFHTFCILPLPAIFIYVLIIKLKHRKKLFSTLNSQLSTLNSLILTAILLISLALSVQLYLPIRSSTEPLMNQNNPAKIENFWDVLNRKQYGDMNMFERALYRRGALINQFGFSENIGYLGYHLNQWVPAPLGAQTLGTWGESRLEKMQFFHRIIFQFLIIAVFAGVWMFRKNPSAMLITAMFLLSSAGLVFYLNMADGTKLESYRAKQWNSEIKELRKLVPNSIPNLTDISKVNTALSFYASIPEETRENWLKIASAAEGLRTFLAWNEALKEHGKKMPLPPKAVHRDVRNRDYFFTPAFLFFAIMSAIACSAAFQKLTGRAERFATLGLMFAWTIPFACNFEANNRSKDFIARDFAMNVLNSVPQNGILITYGDNDTFPLWYMQMAENYRTDVVVINDALAYSDWYREQVLRAYPKLMENEQWIMDSERDFIYKIIDNNWPERSVNFMLGAKPEDYEEFSENMHLIGLVRNLGMEKSAADSFLLANLTANYSYSELKARGQEANEQTMQIYKYLANIALRKEPNEEQRSVLQKLIVN
ncbi:MAG: DUF2723 domain-containing protein [Fibromonadales bacterium]|nr:DUF2723 domain-containing protein [Fibromonadales bacterium]